MTLKEVLKLADVDITTNKSILANQLLGDLAIQKYSIDFDKKMEDVTEEDLYQIGRSLILSERKGEAYTADMIIHEIRIIFEKAIQEERQN